MISRGRTLVMRQETRIVIKRYRRSDPYVFHVHVVPSKTRQDGVVARSVCWRPMVCEVRNPEEIINTLATHITHMFTKRVIGLLLVDLISSLLT